MKNLLNKNRLTSVFSLLFSFLAASCCISPALIIVFGTSFGFLSNFSILEPLRPVFIIVAVCLLSYSFWRLFFRKKNCDCEENKKVKIISRIIFFISLFIFIFSIVYPYLIYWIYSK